MNDDPYRSPNADETSVPISNEGSPVRYEGSSSWSSLALKVLVIGGIVFVAIAMLLPTVRLAPEAARRTQCHNHLKQIAIALHSYYDEHGAFPPAYTVDENGKRLHSWRTLILPYLEQGQLYESIDLTKPWDDPINAKAAQTQVKTYQCPSVVLSKDRTNYLAVVTADSCLNSEPRKLEEITDGTNQTIMVIEVAADQAVPWMSPEDAGEAQVLDLRPGTPLPHPAGAQGVFADSSVHFIPSDLPAAQRRALITIAGSDDVGDEVVD